jgi:PmbA protein
MADSGIEQFREKIFAAAQKKGFTEYEIYYEKGSSFSVKVFEGEIREYKNSGDAGLSFRGVYRGRMGYAYSERIGDDVIPFLVENAAQNAEIIEDPDIEDLFAGSPEYPAVKTWDESLSRIPAGDKIAMALKMEKAALRYDKRVVALDYCQLGTGEGERYIANSLGLKIADRENYAFAFSMPRVQGDNGQVKSNGEDWRGKALDRFDPEALGRKSAEIALSYLDAKSVPTGNYRIIFNGNAMGELLQTFAGIFNAENVQKGFSLLKDKIGGKIAAETVTLRDDPLLDNRWGSASFDSEGVAARNKIIIDRGILKTYLHNRKTAKKDGVEPTGNGFKGSFKSSVGIAPTNLYILPGDQSRDALLALKDHGLLISNLAGLHSGANPTSGDFSVSAEGHLVEQGRKSRAVEQITLAGNFFTLLQNILAVGSDLEFKGSISSPSVLVKELSVAGQEK